MEKRIFRILVVGGATRGIIVFSWVPPVAFLVAVVLVVLFLTGFEGSSSCDGSTDA